MKQNLIWILAGSVLISVLGLPAMSLAQVEEWTRKADMPDFAAEITSTDVWAHIEYLSVTIGTRIAGTQGEEAAAQYIADEFAAMGAPVSATGFSAV